MTTMTTPTTTPTTAIGTADLKRLRLEDPELRIIDVRTGGEFETAHIPGSYNVPLDVLGEHVGQLAAMHDTVVLVCQSGARATQAQTKLDTAGKSGLFVLDGGMNAWEAAAGDVARGEITRWAMDRQVRLVAGSLALAGVLASVVAPKAKWLSAGVAGGLVFSAVSNTCAMANVLSRLPYNRVDGCDIDAVLQGTEAAAA